MSDNIVVRIADKIAPPFYGLHKALKNGQYSEYWLKGGRGSTKSSFISLEIIMRMNRRLKSNCVIFMKTGDIMRESVFEQMKWAINELEQNHLWKASVSPMSIINIDTKQKIIFKGLYDTDRTKGAKIAAGEYDIVWFEELSNFKNIQEVETAINSYIRGAESPVIFYSYNPPQNISNWVNAECLIEKKNRVTHSSSYLDIPEKLREKWLGKIWLENADHVKATNEKKYNHVYLGESNGTGGEIFSNITLRHIADEEITRFDCILRGIDWGYAVDPFGYGVMYFDMTRKKLYIFKEVYKVGYKNRVAIEMLQKDNYFSSWIIADSSEPKSVQEFRDAGLLIKGAVKGPGSIEYGIKFLQGLEEIIIDPIRCPNASREFSGYEYEGDNNGGFRASYPDHDNHFIDLTRYALEPYTRQANRQN